MKHTTSTSIVASSLICWFCASACVGCSCSGDDIEVDIDSEQVELNASAPAATPPPPEILAQAAAAAREEPEEHPLPVEEDSEEETPAEEAVEEATEEATEEAAEEEAAEDTYPLQAVAYQFITNVVSAPRSGSRVIGYLRRGARVRVTERVRGRGCTRGWHEVEGGGYVCHADGVVVGESPEDWPDAPAPPRLDEPLPYDYMSSVRDNVPEYWERPSSEQESQVATAIRALRAAQEAESAEQEDVDVDETPEEETVDEPQPADEEASDEEDDRAAQDDEDEEEPERVLPSSVRMLLSRGFIVSVTETVGRWYRTVRGRYIDRTVLTEREAPEFQGVELGSEMTLPLAFVVRGRAKALRPRPGSTLRFEVAGTLRRLSALPVLGEVMRGDQRYISVGKRLLARADILAIAEPIERPPHVGADEQWIDICLSTQTLVAYEGDSPVYATLVSSGRSSDGYGTPTGSFRIATKHVSTTMDDPNGGDEAYSIEDVPWTMYFHESYALHGAFWHNHFGRERSHGCVNLSPADARWLFFWATPELPPGWHGVRGRTGNTGTAVIIRP